MTFSHNLTFLLLHNKFFCVNMFHSIRNLRMIIIIFRINLTYLNLTRNIFMYPNVNMPNHVLYWPQKSAFPILLTCRFPKYHTFNISVSNDLRLSFHVPLLCVFPFEMHYYNSFSLNGQVLEYQSQTNIHRFCGGGCEDETCFSCYFQNNLVLGNAILYTSLLDNYMHFLYKIRK